MVSVDDSIFLLLEVIQTQEEERKMLTSFALIFSKLHRLHRYLKGRSKLKWSYSCLEEKWRKRGDWQQKDSVTAESTSKDTCSAGGVSSSHADLYLSLTTFSPTGTIKKIIRRIWLNKKEPPSKIIILFGEVGFIGMVQRNILI